MAVSVQKFIAPPVFSASPEEDAVDWLERFELAATYNRWSDADHAPVNGFLCILIRTIGKIYWYDQTQLTPHYPTCRRPSV
jgi:hypothetical protein